MLFVCKYKWTIGTFLAAHLTFASCVLQEAASNPEDIMQEVVDLAQAVYAGPAPDGCGRVIRRELKGQRKLLGALKDAGYGSVLTEKEVPIDVTTDIKGRYDLFIDGIVVVELKNVGKLNDNKHRTQIRDYMGQLGCMHGVLVNFPNDGSTAVEAKQFTYTAGCAEPTVKTLHAIAFD